MHEKSLVIIKPDAVQRRIAGKIISRIEEKGLKITAMKMKNLEKTILEKHYSEHKGKPFYNTLTEFMTTGPCILLLVEGFEAVSVVRKIVGATNGREAEPGTIRGDYSMSKQNNLIHASADKKASEKETELFFKAEERAKYSVEEKYIYSNEEMGR